MVTNRPRMKPRRKGERLSDDYNRAKALQEAGQKERAATEKRAAAALKFLLPVKRTQDVLAEQVLLAPFTGQAYQEAAESQRQEKVQKWHDINTGFEAALMAQLGADLGIPLIKGGLKWLKNKAVSPAARTMMNPENFTFEGPLIKPITMDVPSLEETLKSLQSPLGGNLVELLPRKPLTGLPQPKLQLRLPAYDAHAQLDIAPQDAGLTDVTDGDLFGIRLADTALKRPIKISPHDMPSELVSSYTGDSAQSVVDNLYSRYIGNLPFWEVNGLRPPLPYITSVGDESLSVGFRPLWYKMIDTPTHLERITSFAGPTRSELVANLSPEAKAVQRARELLGFDLFDEWLGPEARSAQQIAIDDEIDAFNAAALDRVLFDTNVDGLYTSGLITPRHRKALIHSYEPLKYFGDAVQHNIMKKAIQNYFKDIKAAKQKDYASRVIEARKEEDRINAGLNDRANALYYDLQGSIKPPQSLNSLINDANKTIGQIRGIGDIVEDTFKNYLTWKADPNPGGWLLKYLMQGNKLERQLSKDGTISVNSINDQVKNGSDIEKYVTEKVLNEKFAGQSKVNYADFKHAVQDELVTYRTQQSHRWEKYGMDRIGYTSLEDGGRVKLDTYTFSTPRISEGSNKHFNNDTLGHSRTFVSEDEPDVMHVLESLSDWGQSKLSTMSKEEYEATLERLNSDIETAKSNRDFFLLRLEGDSPTLDDANSRDTQIQIINDLQNQRAELIEQIERGVTDPHTIHLHKNWESHLIQENMMHAADKGLTKMRYPTEETAAKIEGYSKQSGTRREMTQAELDEYHSLSEFVNKSGKDRPKLTRRNRENMNEVIKQRDAWDAQHPEWVQANRRLEEINNTIAENNGRRILIYDQASSNYSPEHQTILRKYAEFPKKFKKIYKNSEVREVTDSKGNTWYEVDVPKDLRKRERAYSIAGTVIAGGTAASTLKPRKKQ